LKASDITPPEYADVDQRASLEITATGVCAPLEKEYLRKDGTRVPVLVGAANFEDSPQEGVAFVLDLTQRKKLEQQFLRAQRMESIGTLAGGVAHDLNNMLTPILMSIDLLRLGEEDNRRLRTLQAIEESARRGSDLIQKLLAFARGSDKRRTAINVATIIKEIALVAQDALLKHIEVKVEMPDDLWTVSADPTGLHQVFMNLCVNAKDAMPRGGLLRLSARNLWLDRTFAAMQAEAKEGPYVVIEVEDTGVGMEPAVLERIFEPFFTTKELGDGTGLGLSTALGIVKSHGGILQVESKRGKGSMFRIHLPADVCQAQQAAITAPTAPPLGNGELVLVVDDEASIRQITKQTLEGFGYNVLLASDGVEAAALFAERGSNISAVVTDLMMPVMDGRLTMQVMRKMNPDVRLIAISGFCNSETPEQLGLMGVKSFLKKPFTGEALLKTLAEVLPRDPALAALN
jgi:signal transduction histidine kinase/ActR/RegA family two-component response regulator